LLRVYQLDVSNKFRLGVPSDGGYVVGVPPPNGGSEASTERAQASTERAQASTERAQASTERAQASEGEAAAGEAAAGEAAAGEAAAGEAAAGEAAAGEASAGEASAACEAEYDCYISAGVSTEESFTRDFIARFGGGCDLNVNNCFAFDGTIEAYPVQYTDKITFFKKNIGGGEVDSDSETNLLFLLNTYSRVFLKMDIEGGEYPWLLRMSLDDLRKIKQIVIEFHGITGDGWGCSYNDKVRCLAKLAETHYIVHAHGNNHSHTLHNIPDVIELTCILKSCWADGEAPGLNTTPLPIAGLDFSNMLWRTDYDLNLYPFVEGGSGGSH
jgi:hypothetical protein